MIEVHYMKKDEVKITVASDSINRLSCMVHEDAKPITADGVNVPQIQYKTEEIDIREYRLGKHKFYIAARNGTEWYTIVAKLATEVGEYSEAIQAGIDMIRYSEKQPAFVVVSSYVLDKLLSIADRGQYQPAYMSENGVDTYMNVPIAVVSTDKIIVKVV